MATKRCTTWSRLGEMPYCFSTSSVNFKGRMGQKIADFDPNCAFPGWNSSFNSPMAMKWSTKLEVAWKRCRIVFQGYLSNFKVTRGEELTIWLRFESLQLITPIQIIRWLQMTHIAFRGKQSLFIVFRMAMSHQPKDWIWVQFGQGYWAGQISQSCLVSSEITIRTVKYDFRFVPCVCISIIFCRSKMESRR